MLSTPKYPYFDSSNTSKKSATFLKTIFSWDTLYHIVVIHRINWYMTHRFNLLNYSLKTFVKVYGYLITVQYWNVQGVSIKNASVAFCLLLMQPCKVSFIFFHIFPRSKVLSNRNCIKENKWYHHIFHVQESTTPNLVPPSFVILVLLHFSLTLRVRRDSVWYLREFNTCYSNHSHVSAINSTYWNI